MTALHFVDSNVLVYRHDRSDDLRRDRASAVLSVLWKDRAGRVSAQVLQEFYVTSTRKLAVPLSREAARREVRQLQAWEPVETTLAIRDDAFSIEDRYGFSYWDALIVAAARSCRCQFLLTEDLQDGQDLGGLLVVNPFVHGTDVLSF